MDRRKCERLKIKGKGIKIQKLLFTFKNKVINQKKSKTYPRLNENLRK